MGGLLTEVGRKLAEKWVTLLALPGALYLAVATAAVSLGHTHPFDLSRTADRITAWADRSAAAGGGGQVVLLLAVLAAAAMAGLAAQALGSLLERLWLAADWPAWPRPARTLAARRTARRRRAWIAAARTWHRRRDDDIRSLASGNRADPAARHAAERAMTRIAVEEPTRPTWSGDRLNAAVVRIERDQGLDLAATWPHLWLALPDGPRGEVTAARQALTRATTLAAWALLYLPLTLRWWPAALVACVLALTARARTHAAVDAYALLLEAATRLHARDLAGHLGLDATVPLTLDAADTVTRYLTPTAPPPPDGSDD
ncbi:hypothetical protein [Streptomyces sp. CoH17]|uniref:hypothetical protein n=1 Tax=Streptomyces sp. CoH17 TaxID=2992806 RepID=UPI00226FA9B3|nr:hypothetical protein [Streptomyces sp. CoH17]